MATAVPVPPPDLFTTHYEDAQQPLLTAHVSRRLRMEGLVTLDGLAKREDLLNLARLLMRITPHRDSDRDGVTEISATRQLGDLRGRRGLGRGEVLPHTDSAQASPPPRLLLMACQQPARSGGVTTLVDSREVHATLAAEYPDVLETLEHPRAAFFGTGAGRFTAIFTRHGDRAEVALRQDELAQFSPTVHPHLPTLREVVRRHSQHLLLRAGQAYLLDNSRWLHARTAFRGPRTLLRVLGEPLPRLALQSGFPVAVPLRSTAERCPT